MRKRLLRRPSPAMIVAIIAVILAVGGTATAALTKKDKKKVKNIATSVFNQNAPTLKDSCPSGTVRVAGECFETAARAGTDIRSASDICAAAGRRVPSAGELLAARGALALVGSNVTDAEMSSDLFRDGANFGFIGVIDDGNIFSIEGSIFSQAHQYRCVGPLTNS